MIVEPSANKRGTLGGNKFRCHGVEQHQQKKGK